MANPGTAEYYEQLKARGQVLTPAQEKEYAIARENRTQAIAVAEKEKAASGTVYTKDYLTDPVTGQQVARSNAVDQYGARLTTSAPQYDQETGEWYTVDTQGVAHRADAPGVSSNYVGGSAGTSGLIIGGLKEKGQETLDLYTGLAKNIRREQQSYADTATQLGDKAYLYGQGLTGQLKSQDALLQQQYGAIPQSYGDDATMRQWQAANKGLQYFEGGQAANQLTGSYDALQGYANQGPGPSAAQAQLQQSLGQNIAAQFAMANSGRNAGANAMAARNAGFTAADMSQKTATELATLRANEEAQWRQQQLSALASAASTAGAIDTSGISRAAQELSAQQAAAGQYGTQYSTQAQTQQAAQQDRLSALAQRTALQNQQYTQGMANWGQRTAANTTASDIANRGAASLLSAYGAGTSADMGYQSSALDLYTGNANRAAASESQDKGIAASEYAASQLESERNLDRALAAAGGVVGALADTKGK